MSVWTAVRYAIIGLTWFGLAHWIDAASDALTDIFAAMFAFLGFPLVGVAWVAYSVAWPGVFHSRVRSAAWASVPVALALALAVTVGDWPVMIRVWLSEEELTAYVESRAANPVDHHPDEWAGLFKVHKTKPIVSGTQLFTSTSFTEAGGLIHSPAGPPHDLPQYTYAVRHLYGPWYRFTDGD